MNNEEKIKFLKDQIEDLEKQIASNQKDCFNQEIKELQELLRNPNYEVQEKEEITNNLTFFAEEYKSLIREIQEAAQILRQPK